MSSKLTVLLIWVAVIGVAFAFAWWKGYLQKLSDYVAQTREELKKCTWPTRDELKGSTVLVGVSVGLIGLFIVAVDFIFSRLMIWISRV